VSCALSEREAVTVNRTKNIFFINMFSHYEINEKGSGCS
jgi:hypothetical protein